MRKRQPVRIEGESDADEDTEQRYSPMADKKVFGHDVRRAQNTASSGGSLVVIFFELCNLQKEDDTKQAEHTHTRRARSDKDRSAGKLD